MLQEFKPSLLFLAKFLIIYVVGNVVYGLYIESCGEQADSITVNVTKQTVAVLRFTGEHVIEAEPSTSHPRVAMNQDGEAVLNVFEGCNGVNVMIVFVAFMFAFGGPLKKYWWYISLGIVIIHVFNLLRIGLLYHTALDHKQYFYYIHKYFFTAILYIVVFVMWMIWIMKFNRKRQHE